MVTVKEHNFIAFDPVSIYALGLYRNACERQTFEWDEEYEISLDEAFGMKANEQNTGKEK